METPIPEGAGQADGAPTTPDGDARADLAFALMIVVVLVGVSILYVLFPAILVVLMISALLSYALLPVVDWLERRRLTRTISVMLVAVVGAGVLVLTAVLLAPTVAHELQRIPEAIQKLSVELQTIWAKLEPRLPGPIADAVERISQSFRRGDAATQGTETIARYAGSAAAGITAVASGLVLVPVFVFLMLRGYHPFVQSLQRFVPPRWRPQFFARTKEADRVLSGFIRGQLLVALILAVMYSIAFSLIGIPLAIIVGILAGIGELIPFVGNAIALLLGSLLALVGGQPLDVLWVVGSYLAIQTFQGTVMGPYIMGKKVHLSPITVIVSLAIGAELLGVIGMLAAVPATALLKVAAQAATDAYRHSAFFRRTAS